MVGADVVVTIHTDTYREQVRLLCKVYCCLHVFNLLCRGGVGLSQCPDTLLASGSDTQDVSVVAGDVIIRWSPRLSIYN